MRIYGRLKGEQMFPFLNLPFFDQNHRDLAAGLSHWATAQLDGELSSLPLGDQCRQLVRLLGEAGFLQLVCPDNPFEVDVRSICLARQILSYHSSIADFAFAMQGLGTAPIWTHGSEEQRSSCLHRVRSGEATAAFALTEAKSGSDVSSIETIAARSGDGFVLNGAKAWISNAGIADQYVVFARTGEAPGAKGLSAFLVEADNPGLIPGDQLDLIAPHPIANLTLTNCRVSPRALIGNAGEGFKVAMGALDIFRSTVGAAAIGLARRAIDEAIGWVSERRLFGQILRDFQATRMRLADMMTSIEASELLVYRAAWSYDSARVAKPKEAAMAKLFATESAQKTIDDAVQLFGANGVLSGQVVERLFREIRAMRIYEGTTEIQKLVIANNLLKQANTLPPLGRVPSCSR